MNPRYAGGDRFDNPPSWAIREWVNSAVTRTPRASSTRDRRFGGRSVTKKCSRNARTRLTCDWTVC
jgi:hypothetical protein